MLKITSNGQTLSDMSTCLDKHNILSGHVICVFKKLLSTNKISGQLFWASRYSWNVIMCIHLCSAGVGRSGTYITLDTMLQRMPHTNNVNAYEFVHNMRMKRVFMVQTLVSIRKVYIHYQYGHCLLLCVYRRSTSLYMMP